MQTRSNLICAI